MKIFGFEITKRKKRNYEAAAIGRLYADWILSQKPADEEIRYSLKTLRARSRNLVINNDYARKFKKMVSINVVGPQGIRLQNKAVDANGQLDKKANDIIEAAWHEWNKRGNYDVTGTLSGLDGQRLFIETAAVDGEVIIRKIKGADTPFRFALQFIEADYLDIDLNKELPNGNRIVMGVEFDKWGRPVAYYILAKHPGTGYASRHERIAADEIIHAYVRERITQSRGVPWMHSAMTRLHNIGKYEEAEIVASRAAAAKMGIIKSPTGAEYVGDGMDTRGNIITEMEPGVIEQLPQGMDFELIDPTHPAGNFQPFIKTTLRGIASGLLVSYNSLAGDLESVNYSSIRAGFLEERDCWRTVQAWMIDAYCNSIFPDWLSMAMLSGAVQLPISKFKKFNAPKWQPRTWAWVDPLKDAQANVVALDNGLASRTDIAAEDGQDFEELLIQLQQEKALMQKYGIEFPRGAGQKVSLDESYELAGNGGSKAKL